MKIQRPVYSMAASPLQAREGVSARVERVVFSPALDAPPDRPFAFVYAITVRNDSSTPIIIKGRKWVIREVASGRCQVIEGDGVAGLFPKIGPGESYSYESYHVVADHSVAEGALLACDENGSRVLVRIPAFAMTIPH
jgi:ApaG protein